MCFNTVWMSSWNICMCAKRPYSLNKGSHNGALVDRSGQPDCGKLSAVTHGIVFIMNPTVRSHSVTLIHRSAVLHNLLCLKNIYFHTRRFLCVNNVFWFQLVAHCSPTMPASRAFGLREITVIPLELYILRKSLPAVLKCALGGGTSGPVMRC